MFGTSLADEKVMGERLANLEKRMEFLRKNFGNSVSTQDLERFMRARTPRQLERAVQKLFAQGIQKVEVSSRPFVGDIHTTEATLVDIKQLTDAEQRNNPSEHQ